MTCSSLLNTIYSILVGASAGAWTEEEVAYFNNCVKRLSTAPSNVLQDSSERQFRVVINHSLGLIRSAARLLSMVPAHGWLEGDHAELLGLVRRVFDDAGLDEARAKQLFVGRPLSAAEFKMLSRIFSPNPKKKRGR